MAYYSYCLLEVTACYFLSVACYLRRRNPPCAFNLTWHPRLYIRPTEGRLYPLTNFSHEWIWTGLVHKTTLGRHAAVKRMPTLILRECTSRGILAAKKPYSSVALPHPAEALYVVYCTTYPFPSDFSRHKQWLKW